MLRLSPPGLRALTLAAALAGGAAAAEAARCAVDLSRLTVGLASDPCPAVDAGTAELSLPTPVPGIEIVFREVRVANTNYWCSESVVALGDPARGGRDEFTALRPGVEVFGTFDGEDGQSLHLGKYELTFGQLAAMLSIDRLDETPRGLAAGLDALDALLDRADDHAEPLREARADLEAGRAAILAGGRVDAKGFRFLANPARGLTPIELDDALARYNGWCYRDAACRAALDRLSDPESPPVFVRPPTEIEWEYAARGGDVADAEFAAYLRPWTGRDFEAFASVAEGGARVRVVGVERRPTRGGFYDLIGNVQELTYDPFRPLLEDGRVGGRTARGGSAITPANQLSFATRAEVLPHRFRAEADGAATYEGPLRDAYTGLRLALGAAAKPTGREMERVREAYAAECASPSIEAIGGVADCDGTPPSALEPVCARLKQVSREARQRYDSLCRTTAEALLFSAFKGLDVAYKAVTYEGLIKVAAERFRARYRDEHGEAVADLDMFARPYGQAVHSAVREFSDGCLDRAIRTTRSRMSALAEVRTRDLEIAKARVEEWTAAASRVRADAARIRAARGRPLAPRELRRNFLQSARELKR